VPQVRHAQDLVGQPVGADRAKNPGTSEGQNNGSEEYEVEPQGHREVPFLEHATAKRFLDHAVHEERSDEREREGSRRKADRENDQELAPVLHRQRETQQHDAGGDQHHRSDTCWPGRSVQQCNLFALKSDDVGVQPRQHKRTNQTDQRPDQCDYESNYHDTVPKRNSESNETAFPRIKSRDHRTAAVAGYTLNAQAVRIMQRTDGAVNQKITPKGTF